MKKYFLYLLIIGFILIIAILGIHINKYHQIVYNDIGVITNNGDQSFVKIENEEKELTIKSNIFSEGNNVKILYKKKWGKPYPIKIEAILDDEEAKELLVQQIKEDSSIKKYAKAISGYYFFEEEKIKISDFNVKPDIIDSQNYITVSPNEFLKFYNPSDCDCIILSLPTNVDYTFKINEEFKNIVIEYFEDSFVKTLPYNLNDSTLTFKPTEPTIYTFKVEFKNGDIIDYIFKIDASY